LSFVSSVSVEEVAFHLFRVVTVNMGTPYIYLWMASLIERRSTAAPGTKSAPGT